MSTAPASPLLSPLKGLSPPPHLRRLALVEKIEEDREHAPPLPSSLKDLFSPPRR